MESFLSLRAAFQLKIYLLILKFKWGKLSAVSQQRLFVCMGERKRVAILVDLNECDLCDFHKNLLVFISQTKCAQQDEIVENR